MNLMELCICHLNIGKRKGRHFTDIDEKRLIELLSHTEFKLLVMKITKDVRVNHNEKWLNVIIKK